MDNRREKLSATVRLIIAQFSISATSSETVSLLTIVAEFTIAKTRRLMHNEVAKLHADTF